VDVTEMRAVLKNNGLALVDGEFSGDARLDTEEALNGAAKALRANADRLAGRGLLVLRRADAPNAGLLIDVWHFYNGGGHPDQLNDLPGAGITGVQPNDGPLVRDNFQQHARAERHLPGEGELDVVGLIRAVRRTGFTGPYCVESNTPEFRKLPVAEAARRAADTAATVLRSAGVLA
jgi:sugar phosphate isomerase/epimerase